MKPSQLDLILEKLATGTATEEEGQQFAEWLQTAPAEEVGAILDKYSRIIKEKHPPGEEVDKTLVAQIEAALDQHDLGVKRDNKHGRIISMRFLYRIAAASVIIFISVAIGYYVLKPRVSDPVAVQQPPMHNKDVLPGINKAILTLSDNSVVVLDDSTNGQVAKQGNTRITKLSNGQLVYHVDGKAMQAVYNTLTTPKGGQFKLTLPDGSKVWLNAASSIKYPTAFNGNQREVHVTGEAYFEIIHNKSKPFRVKANEMEVTVLGTHFNINAYDDEEAVKTTLIEGSVRLTRDGKATTLKPGQQAQIGKQGTINVVADVDTDEVMAWKNGFFQFEGADLKTVMRQLARWYDVDVVYMPGIPERQFAGQMSRDENLSVTLDILKESNVHFQINGKQLILMP